jgi:hypothetical protein
MIEKRFPLPITEQTVKDVKPFMLQAAAVGMKMLRHVEDNHLVLEAVTVEEIAERIKASAGLYGGIKAVEEENGIIRFIPFTNGPSH